MGEARNANWYDVEYFKNKNDYHDHYSQSRYYDMWKEIVKLFLKDVNKRIVDIGCGPGQFANLLYDFGFKNYVGFDFSTSALLMAEKLNLKKDFRFVHMDIEEMVKLGVVTNLYCDIIITFETLEHLKEPLDIEFLKSIAKGKEVIFSVPNFDSVGHARYFPKVEDVMYRYFDFLTDITLFEYKDKNKTERKYYIVRGIKI